MVEKAFWGKAEEKVAGYIQNPGEEDLVVDGKVYYDRKRVYGQKEIDDFGIRLILRYILGSFFLFNIQRCNSSTFG